ncbi:hypothetical protein Vafri_14249, partial [Volvox africanus]
LNWELWLLLWASVEHSSVLFLISDNLRLGLASSGRQEKMLLRSCPATFRAAGRSSQICVNNRRLVMARAKASVETAHLVKDVMTSGKLFSCGPEDTVDSALELLVQHRITGLPVVDAENRVVGVVSDFDLLALDAVGRVNEDQNLFPSADQSWQAFKEVKKMLAKSAGKKIKDVMTVQPITVRPETNLEDATK